MAKHVGSCITLILLPGIIFAVIFLGAAFFVTPKTPTFIPEEQYIPPSHPPSSLCGNGICEKIERDDVSCEEDC